MFYNSTKIFVKKFPPVWNLLRWLKDSLIKLSRLKDVFMMMILFHIWPEQTYRFSTRRFLPAKKNRYSEVSKPKIPYDLLESKSSNITKMKEINIVGHGNSFDLNNLKNFDAPTFLISFWSPLKIDNEGKVIYKHAYSYEDGKSFSNYKAHSLPKEHFYNRSNKEFEKEKVTYVVHQTNALILFKKNGYNVLSVESYMTDKDGNYHPVDREWETDFHRNLFDNENCRYISVVDKVYKPPLLKPHPSWAPAGSFLSAIGALSNFAEKINIYGWDFYLSSSPAKMNYWQLFFSMYKYKYDVSRSKNHFESALINFYYGFQLSKLPNIKIHGYLGQLSKHEKLIKRIERVLFN